MITLQFSAAEPVGIPLGVGMAMSPDALPAALADFAAVFAAVPVAPTANAATPVSAGDLETTEPAVSPPAGYSEAEAEAEAPQSIHAQPRAGLATFAALELRSPLGGSQIPEKPAADPSVEPDAPDASVQLTGDAIAEQRSGATGPPLPIQALVTQDGPPAENAAPANEPQAMIHIVSHQHRENKAPAADAAIMVIAASAVVDPVKRPANATSQPTELLIAPQADTRPALAAPAIDKPLLPMPERIATFAPIIADAVRDLASIAQNKDLRFNVRPETLGAVAVTIERTDAGPALRLGVETAAAVHAVRQAEPMMNDPRGAAPFVQITIDMNAPDSRGRSPRAMPLQHAAHDHVSEQMQSQQPVSAGRYA